VLSGAAQEYVSPHILTPVQVAAYEERDAIETTASKDKRRTNPVMVNVTRG